jgi:hypothetical protein
MLNRIAIMLVLAGAGSAAIAADPPLPEGAIARLGASGA